MAIFYMTAKLWQNNQRRNQNQKKLNQKSRLLLKKLNQKNRNQQNRLNQNKRTMQVVNQNKATRPQKRVITQLLSQVKVAQPLNQSKIIITQVVSLNQLSQQYLLQKQNQTIQVLQKKHR